MPFFGGHFAQLAHFKADFAFFADSRQAHGFQCVLIGCIGNGRNVFVAQLLHCDPPLRQTFAIILNDQCKVARPCTALENRFSPMQLDHFAQVFGHAIGRHQVMIQFVD